MALADYDSSYDSYNSYDDGYDYNYDYDFGDTDMWAPEDSYGTDEDASPYGTFTLDEIASVFEADGISQGEPGEGDVCTKGFYTVGPAGQIPAGLYYLEGSNEKLSHYYVFDGDDGRYSVDDSVQYFGNYFVDLDEGDLIVFDPGDEATMYPAPSTSTDPTGALHQRLLPRGHRHSRRQLHHHCGYRGRGRDRRGLGGLRHEEPRLRRRLHCGHQVRHSRRRADGHGQQRPVLGTLRRHRHPRRSGVRATTCVDASALDP